MFSNFLWTNQQCSSIAYQQIKNINSDLVDGVVFEQLGEGSDFVRQIKINGELGLVIDVGVYVDVKQRRSVQFQQAADRLRQIHCVRLAAWGESAQLVQQIEHSKHKNIKITIWLTVQINLKRYFCWQTKNSFCVHIKCYGVSALEKTYFAFPLDPLSDFQGNLNRICPAFRTGPAAA
jgi:hypothetical protein